MFDELLVWLQAILPENYQFSRGMWIEAPQTYDSFICAIQPAGGAAVDVDDRRPRYRIILLGPRNGRHEAGNIQSASDLIIQATIEENAPCSAAGIRSMSEPTLGYTVENRAWVQIELQITY